MGVAKKFEAKKEGEGDIFCQRCSCWDDQIRRENQWKYLRIKLYWPDIASCVWLDVSLICTCTLSVSFCICICFCIVSVFCFCICQLLTGSQVCAARWRPSLTLLTEPPVEAASFFTPVPLQNLTPVISTNYSFSVQLFCRSVECWLVSFNLKFKWVEWPNLQLPLG